jgi:hypothetical protein
MLVGTIFAFLTAVYLAFVFLPSITSTILRLRCGMIPTLHDRHFNKYRFAGDQVSILTGSMFWGSLISSALVGGAVGFIVFLFLWQVRIVSKGSVSSCEFQLSSTFKMAYHTMKLAGGSILCTTGSCIHNWYVRS